MSAPLELSQDFKSHSYSMLLKSFGEENNNCDCTHKLENFLYCLEEETQKIDVFKRELPLCMQLLTNAVETSRQQLQAYITNRERPVLKQFFPLKSSASENLDGSSNISDKVNWMTTAQLRSQPQPPTLTSAKETNDIGINVCTELGLACKQRNGGVCLPFSEERNLCPRPSLGTASPEKEIEGENCKELSSVIEQVEGGGNSSPNGKTTYTANGNTTSQTHRKARRWWSPDLHRRFLKALQTLGGSQAATPKQIRELMKIEGLTNDEVKSHLQKYRLHARTTSPSPQIIFVGGIWVPPEYSTSNGGHTISGGQHHPANYHAPPPPHQDFYTSKPASHVQGKATSQPNSGSLGEH